MVCRIWIGIGEGANKQVIGLDGRLLRLCNRVLYCELCLSLHCCWTFLFKINILLLYYCNVYCCVLLQVLDLREQMTEASEIFQSRPLISSVNQVIIFLKS